MARCPGKWNCASASSRRGPDSFWLPGQPFASVGPGVAHFNGKVTIVTGGASGIGRALCEELARRGAQVLVADISAEAAAAVAAGIQATGGAASAHAVDVTDAGQVQGLVQRAATEHQRLDFMFNNAGISVCGETRDLDLADWKRVIDINLMGVIHGTLAAYRVMVRQGSGHIINTSSMAGLTPMPLNAPYSAAKHAVVGLSTTLRHEARALGVNVSVVCPSGVLTPMLKSTKCVGISSEFFDRFPVRLLDPDSAARAILRGVERNHEFILFPFHAHVLWRLYRLYPPLIRLFTSPMLARGRSLRTSYGGGALTPSDK